MKSLTNLYRIGKGPSSSHTIGPERAALYFKKKNPDAEGFSVTLYGSLAKTGKGHMTDAVLRQTLAPVPSEIIFDLETESLPWYIFPIIIGKDKSLFKNATYTLSPTSYES